MTAETSQHEDHTFSGIMFDIKTSKLPMEYIEVSSVWVRGDLGPITVWSTDKTFHGKHENGTEWTLHYKRTHNSNNEHFTEMQLDEPVRIMPGSSRGFYVHSALPGDEAIVYDNQRHHESHKNLYMTITPGWAHLSNEAFSDTMQNGFWAGRPWREFREFVGRISYGVRWLLWNPDVHTQLPPSVQVKVWSLLLSQTEKARSVGCLLGLCDKDTLLFILNKISWWEWGGVQQEFERMVTAFERKKRLRQEPEVSRVGYSVIFNMVLRCLPPTRLDPRLVARRRIPVVHSRLARGACGHTPCYLMMRIPVRRRRTTTRRRILPAVRRTRRTKTTKRMRRRRRRQRTRIDNDGVIWDGGR
jgi:hypothetical protein